MRVEGAQKYLIVSFQNGSILTYDLKKLEMVKSINPFSDCLIDNEAFQSNCMIDENATYLAYLHKDKKQINFMTLDWDYSVKKLEKPNLLNSMLMKSERRSS